MKLRKRGRFRNAGWTSLAFGKIDIRGCTGTDNERISLQVKGTDNGSNYIFTLELTDAELMAAVRCRLDAAASGKAEAAVGEGACATIESLLAPPTDV